MNFIKTIFPLSICLLLAGCIREINFEAGETAQSIVAYGRLVNSPNPQELHLFYTTPYGAGSYQDPLPDAQVTIFDGQGLKESYIETSPGVYTLFQNTVKGEPGQTYHLEIALPGGKTIRSRTEKMPPLVQMDSLYWRADSSGTVNAYVDTHLPPAGADGVYLRWETDRVYVFTELSKLFVLGCQLCPPPAICYIWGSFDRQRINLFSSAKAQPAVLMRQAVGRKKIDDTFNEKSCFQTYQISMTRQAFDYWKDVDKAANPDGSIFDTPPATVHGNLYYPADSTELVLGYFEAVAIDTGRVCVIKDQLKPHYVLQPCLLNYNLNGFEHYGYPEKCWNCILIKGSTLEKPWFW